MEWEDISFILRSPLRKAILHALQEEPMAPVQIARETGIGKSNVSTKLGELRDRDMVEVLNPDDRKWRFYTLTTHGRKTLEKAQDIELDETK